MITVTVRTGGRVLTTTEVDPAWLRPDSGAVIWVDLAQPGPEEARILSETFRFHELSVEDALAELHHPKVEAYEGYLYAILHGIDFEVAKQRFATHDIDFFLGERYLVTVHDGRSRSIQHVHGLCARNGEVLADGPAGLMHRIVDAMVDNYRPEVDALETRMEEIEEEVFENPRPELVRRILALKRDVASMRHTVVPQRDAIARLARREFAAIPPALEYRFRDVYDHLVRLSEEALMFQDRITSLLDAHLSNVSNQLNGVMKVLTIIATVFMPLTFVTGLYGMNVGLPTFGIGETRFFWPLLVVMLTVSGSMLWWFRRSGWI
jgi:magnesium transporter